MNTKLLYDKQVLFYQKNFTLSPKRSRALKFLSGNKSQIAQLYHHLSHTLKCVVRKLHRETRTTCVLTFIFEIGYLHGIIAKFGSSNRRIF